MKTFCPLILYHDNISKELSIKLSENQHEYRTVIDRHRDKTHEMLELNARFWMENDIKVSPSTSTTSNISSSSSSSGDSIATLEVKAMDYYEKKPKKAMIAADTTKKRRRGNLPKEVTEFLRKWLIQHKKHPYPAEKEKIDLARHTGLTVNQISNWFINARRRILQPMLESELSAQQQYMYGDYDKRRYYPDTNETDVPMHYHPYSEGDKVTFYTRGTNEQYLTMR